MQRDFTFSGEVDSGFDGYLPLSRGTYHIVGDRPDGANYRTKNIAPVHVAGPQLNAPLPPSDRISIASNAAVTTHAMTTRRRYVTLTDAGPDTAVAAVRVATSVSKSAVHRFLAHPSFSGLRTVSTGKHPDYRIAQDAPDTPTGNDLHPALNTLETCF